MNISPYQHIHNRTQPVVRYNDANKDGILDVDYAYRQDQYVATPYGVYQYGAERGFNTALGNYSQGSASSAHGTVAGGRVDRRYDAGVYQSDTSTIDAWGGYYAGQTLATPHYYHSLHAIGNIHYGGYFGGVVSRSR